MSETTALIGRIHGYLEELERVVDRALLLSKKAIESGDDGYWDGVALNLHGFYSGVERIFEDIARSIDGNIPSGPDWHSALLVQVSSEIPQRRPPIITTEVRFTLDDFRGFRHVVRNIYAFNFRPARLKELTDSLSGCFNALRDSLLTFIQFLESLK
jgi:hypothetical protein